jgi:hypothetical protein
MPEYRPADLAPDADERAFVISTWASSYKHSHFAGLIRSEDWAAVMHDQLGKLIDRSTVRTLVAWDPPAFLYGHIVGDTAGATPIVHYVYVKDPFREAGIARGLFAAMGVDPAKPFVYTSRTSMVVRLTDKIPLARFSPAAARYTKYQESRHGQRRS